MIWSATGPTQPRQDQLFYDDDPPYHSVLDAPVRRRVVDYLAVEFFPAVSPDEKWLIYSSNACGKQTIWKMPIATMDRLRN